MQDEKKEKESHADYVECFQDNANGTIQYREWRLQVGRQGERMAGKTGQDIFLGNMHLLTEETPRDDITRAAICLSTNWILACTETQQLDANSTFTCAKY